jgi:hypothetical protein
MIKFGLFRTSLMGHRSHPAAAVVDRSRTRFRHLAGLAGDHDAGAAGCDHATQGIEDVRGANQVDGEDRLRGGLWGQPGGVDHVHDRASWAARTSMEARSATSTWAVWLVKPAVCHFA